MSEEITEKVVVAGTIEFKDPETDKLVRLPISVQKTVFKTGRKGFYAYGQKVTDMGSGIEYRLLSANISASRPEDLPAKA